MASTMEELPVSISHVGERAAQARELSEEAGILATSSGTVIAQTVTGIREITEAVGGLLVQVSQLQTQSVQISSVIQVIREIANAIRQVPPRVSAGAHRGAFGGPSWTGAICRWLEWQRVDLQSSGASV